MKDIIRNWLPFVVFMATCAILGELKLFSRQLNLSLIIVLIVSVVIVKMLEHPKFK